MANPVVLIHGWSDDSKAMEPLANYIHDDLGLKTQHINLADYLSMDDSVTFDDINAAMDKAWTLSRNPKSVDVVVHSTGGLVIRNWLHEYFTKNKLPSPVHRLLMLAPANFGSPLAHKGTSMVGRVVKGWSSEKRFEVGEQLLKGLELASPFSWYLGLEDLFGEGTIFHKEGVLCTVMVGNSGYKGIKAAANEEGSDGTVRVSTANLNCAYLEVDLSKSDRPEFNLKLSNGQTAFLVLDGYNHATIKEAFGKKSADFKKALTVTPTQFNSWCEQTQKRTNAILKKYSNRDKYKHGYQNTVFHVHDQFSENHQYDQQAGDVEDYFIEFFNEDGEAQWAEDLFYGRQIIRTTHPFSENSAYRAMLIDVTELYKKLAKLKRKSKLQVSLSAKPDIRSGNNQVGYDSFVEGSAIGAIALSEDEIKMTFVANRTLLVDIKLNREQSPEVFRLKTLTVT
ncbi:esterase/lipase family protein [Calditrichota bacterium]